MLNIISGKIKKYFQLQNKGNNEDPATQLINDDNVNDFLADEIEGRDNADPLQTQTTEPQDQLDQPYIKPDKGTSDALSPNKTGEVPYPSASALISSGIAKREAVGFEYITRHGLDIGWRVVEPHYIFYAPSTNNLILVSWDRHVSDIRAFIVGNIKQNGVRYRGEVFQPHNSIMVGIGD